MDRVIMSYTNFTENMNGWDLDIMKKYPYTLLLDEVTPNIKDFMHKNFPRDTFTWRNRRIFFKRKKDMTYFALLNL